MLSAGRVQDARAGGREAAVRAMALDALPQLDDEHAPHGPKRPGMMRRRRLATPRARERRLARAARARHESGVREEVLAQGGEYAGAFGASACDGHGLALALLGSEVVVFGLEEEVDLTEVQKGK